MLFQDFYPQKFCDIVVERKFTVVYIYTYLLGVQWIKKIIGSDHFTDQSDRSDNF